jgi:DNA transposition AAA+ family ATPase
MTKELTDEFVNRAREEVREWMKSRPDITAADLAAFTPLADGTVRGWIAGNFRGGKQVVEGILAAVQKAKCGEILTPGGRESVTLLVDDQRPIQKVLRAGNFYQTQTAIRLWEALDYCAEHAAIGIITADFGCGKTAAARQWRMRRGATVRSAMIEFTEFTAGDKVATIREICRAFDLPITRGNQYGSFMFDAAVDYLRQNPTLLIIDQAETARPRVCQVLRQIHDRTHEAGVGMALLAAPILMARLTGRQMADLGALSSRVGIWAPLGGCTRAELAAIVKQEGITDIDDAALDLWHRATAGSMRRLMRSIDLLKAKHQGKRIGEGTIAGVGSMLWGMNVGRVA